MSKLKYLIMLLVFNGCTLYQINTEETSFDHHPAKTSKHEVAYLESVGQPHEVIGYVTINAERNQKKEEVVDRLKEQAAEIGGDAITNIKSDSLHARWVDHKVLGALSNANVRENYTADVIKFKTEQPANISEN